MAMARNFIKHAAAVPIIAAAVSCESVDEAARPTDAFIDAFNAANTCDITLYIEKE